MDRLGNELVALGLSGRDVRCLLLLPQIYVGWALDPRDVPALQALLDTTVQRAQLGPEELDLARGWLFERPERPQFQSGFALLRALRRAPEQPTIDSSDLLEALLWACRAAQLDQRRPVASGASGPVSPAVAAALGELEAWLEVDGGDLWQDLLAGPEGDPRQPTREERFEALSELELEQATALLEPTRAEWRSSALVRADNAPSPPSAPFPLLRRLSDAAEPDSSQR